MQLSLESRRNRNPTQNTSLYALKEIACNLEYLMDRTYLGIFIIKKCLKSSNTKNFANFFFLKYNQNKIIFQSLFQAIFIQLTFYNTGQ